MRIGLQLPSFRQAAGVPGIGPRLREVADTAEAGGFASLWVMDHFFQIPIVGPAEEEMLEGYTTLSYLAAVTSRIRLGTLVTGVTYREPGIFVKQVTTLDVLSGGRAWLGIGAAWFDREHEGLGVRFPGIGERLGRLEEALRIAIQMWSDDDGPFEGRYYHLAETLCVPRPISRPRPPILIGGGGERRTLRLVAEYADACNLFAMIGIPELTRKLDVLKRHCDDVGRDYGQIEKTALGLAHDGRSGVRPGELIAQCSELAEIGISHVILSLPSLDDLAAVGVIAREVIPEVARL